jgi:predicted lipid-binding transport protein (Tim44 family)
VKSWEEHRQAAVEGASAQRSLGGAAGALLTGVAMGAWALASSDPVITILGGASFLACLAFAGLAVWNVVRFRRGDRLPT